MPKKGTTKKKKIKATLTLLGKKFVSEGSTIIEALSNLNPDHAKSHGVLTLTKGKHSKERVINRVLVNHLFGGFSSLKREIALKNLSSTFNKDDFEQ